MVLSERVGNDPEALHAEWFRLTVSALRDEAARDKIFCGGDLPRIPCKDLPLDVEGLAVLALGRNWLALSFEHTTEHY